MAVQIGKRYKDDQSTIEILVIKPGDCELRVNGRPMVLVQSRVLPSAD